MKQLSEIVIIGASGHSKVIIEILLSQGRKVHALLDDNPSLHHRSILNHSILGNREWLISNPHYPVIVGVGDNTVRKTLYEWCESHDLTFDNAIHQSSQISSSVVLGKGNVFMANSVVNASTHIENNTIVNSGTTVDHDCVIGSHVHIGPGANICGSVSIGDNTLIGVGTCVIPNIKIGKNCVVGAGAVVIRDIPDGDQVVGNPARSILQRP